MQGGADEGIAALDVVPQVGQGAFVEEEELGGQRLSRLSLQDLEEERELGALHGLGVDVHAVDVVEQDLLPPGGREPPLSTGPLVQGGSISFRPLLLSVVDVPVAMPVEQALVGADEKRPRSARGI